eukprot:GFUD01002952.1.p1 GENE.GFUD01002952.1~~GFUD01002952.1.p1  ORF type:complete len:1101 (-),score=245.48 GFUD01002952.1:544-3789(-)
MWSKTFKPGDGKAKRDVAMSAQASLILKKKAEIEAKMAADGKSGQERKERKPISLSINKRWGLKGKKDGSATSSSSKSSTPATSTITSTSTTTSGDTNHWNKYTTPTQSQTTPHHTHTPAFMTSSDSGPGLPPPPVTQMSQPQHVTHAQHVAHPPHQISFTDQLQHPNLPYPPVAYEPNRPPLHSHHPSQTFAHTQVPSATQQPPAYLTQPPPGQPPPAMVQPVSYDLSRPPPMMQPAQTHLQQQPPIQYDSSAPPPQFIHSASPSQSSTANIPPQMLQSPNHPLQPNFPPNLSSHPHSIMSHAPSVSSQQPNPQASQGAPSSIQPPQIIPQMHPGPPYSSIITQPHPTAPYQAAHPEPQMVAPITTINFAPPCSTQPLQYTQPPHPMQQAPPIVSQPPPILSQPPPLSSHPPPIGPAFTHHPSTHIPAHPPPILTHPPPGPPPVTHPGHSLPNITLPPPIDHFQGPPPNQPPLHLFGPPPSATNVSVPPPSSFPDISLPPPSTTFPPPLGTQPPPSGPPPGSGPSWWKDALAKAKDIASVIGKPPPGIGPDVAPPSVPPPGYQTEARPIDKGGHHALGGRENNIQERYIRQLSGDRGELRPVLDRRNSFEGGNGGWQDKHRRDSRDIDIRRRRGSSDYEIREKHERRRSRSRERGRERSPHLMDNRGRDRSPRRRSRSRGNSKDSDRSHYRERHFSGSSSLSTANIKEERDSPGPNHSQNIKRERKFREEKEPVKAEPRDIDLRKPRREGEYSPSRPDYQPTLQVKVEAGDPLPSVVEELASMVAVSGEDLEDIARDRNKNTPELKFLFEKSGPLYKRYRARVAELKESFDDSQGNKRKTDATVKEEPSKKRRSRWGKQEPAETVPSMTGAPSSVGAPGVAIPTALGGLVQKLVSPSSNLTDIKAGNTGLFAYAQRVFGTADLTDSQWKQCEDQLKMSVVYGNLAAKQAMANAMSAAGKIKYEYDSDEETEGGTWEHRARMAEMAKTEQEAVKMTGEAEGKHHIGDFLPPEELNKFMNKYKVLLLVPSFVTCFVLLRPKFVLNSCQLIYTYVVLFSCLFFNFRPCAAARPGTIASTRITA